MSANKTIYISIEADHCPTTDQVITEADIKQLLADKLDVTKIHLSYDKESFVKSLFNLDFKINVDCKPIKFSDDDINRMANLSSDS